MLRKVLKFGTLISLCLISIGLIALALLLQQANARITGSVPKLDQPFLLQLPLPIPQVQDSFLRPQALARDQEPSLDPLLFQKPSTETRPWTRWWLPGNHLDRLELIREIQLFWDHGFGGVEVYPLTAGLDPSLQGTTGESVYEFHTPTYHHNLKLILEEATKRDMQIDVLLGTGTPSGGKHISLEDNLQTLGFGEAFVLGDKFIDLELPTPRIPGSYFLTGLNPQEYVHPNSHNWIHFFPDQKELVALYATKYRVGNRTGPSLDLQDYIQLDSDSTFLITDQVVNGKIRWEAPKGYWKLIAIYAFPTGERPLHSAEASAGFVLDPFDSSKVQAHHRWLLESDQQIPAYFGQGLRGIFHDHFTYQSERFYADHILDDFLADHGYSLSPYLPVLLQPGQNNFWFRHQNWARGPEFVFTEWDDRIRHDYATTISNRFIKDYLSTSNDWASSNQLKSRVQPYGIDIDIIKAVGKSHIPEAEQWYGGGSELFLKLVSSGATWAHKPLVSAETAGHKDMAGNMFPLRLKIAADKLFVSGMNHLVLHGSPYKLPRQSNKESSWVPFASPHYTLGNYSSNFSESSPFWPYQKDLNDYLARCQYALRQGKPVVEVLVYYPFLGFPSSFGKQQAHQELYFNGEIDGFPIPNTSDSSAFPLTVIAKEPDPRNIWLEKVWPMIQILDEAGIQWSWINDEYLAQVQMDELGSLRLNGYPSQMMLIPHAPHMEIEAAENLVRLARKDARIVLYGSAPSHQPGFENREENDELIHSYMAELASHALVTNPKDLQNLLIGYPIQQSISFASHLPFLRQVQRRTSTGDHLVFVSNTIEKDRFASLRSNERFAHYYWLNPTTGGIHLAEIGEDGVLKTLLGPYGSTILYASNGEALEDSVLSERPIVETDFWADSRSTNHELSQWDLVISPQGDKGEYLNFQQSIPQDWRQLGKLQYSESEGLYLHHLTVGDTLPEKKYILDLGEVIATADVRINTIPVGNVSLPPFRLDITGHLTPGDNVIEIWVTPLPRNEWIGKGKKGNKAFAQYQDRSSGPVGLMGPVQLWEVDAPSTASLQE